MRYRPLLCVCLLLAWTAAAASDLVRRPSPHKVAETMDRLAELVEDRGLAVLARIDHRRNAEAAGKTMPDSQVLVFGDAAMSTRIMLHDLASGLDLPLRVLVYADYDGNTWLVYHNPQGLKALYGVEDCRMLESAERILAELAEATTR